MTVDNTPNKPVHLVYLCGGLLLFYLLQWTGDWIWGYFSRSPNELYLTIGSFVVAFLTGVITYRNQNIYGFINEVAVECNKVTWPGWKDVRAATIVVIIMTIISASILGFFDLIWSKVTQLIYG